MTLKTSYYMGADIGTTGCRVSIYDTAGGLAASASSEYALQVPQVGWAEQDPEAIHSAFLSTLAEALKGFAQPVEQIRALTFSAVFHSIFPVNQEGKPLHPMLIFADSRAQSCLGEIREGLDVDALYARTACPLHPMYPFAKLLWFKRHQPELFATAHKFVSIKEFILHRLSGQFVVDRSLATGTGVFNSQALAWDEEALRFLGLSESKLSEVRPTTYIFPKWSNDLLGLPASVRLVVGAGDGVLSTLGAGAIGPGQYTAMIGTSGAVRLCTDKPRTDKKTKNWCYNLTEDIWVVGGAINNGGMAFRWARDKFAANEQFVAKKLNLDAYDVLSRYAEQKPAGSDGLVFLPFLMGERSPHWNANARGVLFGLNMNHGKRHLIRATLEGVLYSMFSVLNSLRNLVPDETNAKVEIRASGSFTRSHFWVQMMADVFGHPIILPGEPEGSVFGAAALGMLATGHLKSAAAIRDLVGKPRAVFTPNPVNHEVYKKLFRIYERVYRSLVDDFEEISALQNELSQNTKPKH